MSSALTSAFHLPGRLAAKADPLLIAADERHFAAVDAALRDEIADVSARLDAVRLQPGGSGQRAMERDLEVRWLAARLALLRRFTLDLCLGRIVPAGGGDPLYIGRMGLTDAGGRRLLVDWRAPVAEPFFAATHGDPRGLASRRRYRWTGRRITDYWDEVFAPDKLDAALAGSVERFALDDQSAFIASLGVSRSPRMRDVLATIQSDQDAIVRAPSRGALVVDGGPGTGKTVVALHRAAYLLYADPLLGAGRGGVLFIGPSDAYLSYVDDVLPSLGEESVQVRTLADLVPEGTDAVPDDDPLVAALKADARWQAVLGRAVRHFEVPPEGDTLVETPWADVVLAAEDWHDAFDSAEPGTPHNEAREQVWQTLATVVAARVRRIDPDVPGELVRRALAGESALSRRFARAWPVLDPARLVAALWSTPAFLRACAPWLGESDLRALERPDPAPWTASDLPLLDAARDLVGDPGKAEQERRREAALAARKREMDAVVDDLIAADDSELLVMRMLRGADAQHSLVDEAELPDETRDPLAGPFAHIVVDEAQELTDAQWHMLLRRCPSRSFTIVGDRAQARHGFVETWEERLARAGLRNARVASLTVNYRTPEEIMAEAAPVIRAAVPDANVPTSVRRSGIPVRHGSVDELTDVLDAWLESNLDGTACVISTAAIPLPARARDRVRALTPVAAKGLEFDLVVLIDPDEWHEGGGAEGAVDRYVAMTRSTRELCVLTSAAA